MSYAVKSIFYTLQGEGAQAGRPAVFLRFSGCNLWSGREQDRADGVGGCSRWCDTDFVGMDGEGGGRFADAAALARAVRAAWRQSGMFPAIRPFVVCTGGEPLLQLDQLAVRALREQGFEVAVETNGTRLPPPGIDWLCVSPKAGGRVVVTKCDELKVVFPQEGFGPDDAAKGIEAGIRSIQPMDGAHREANMQAAIAFCLAHPEWRLSTQQHKAWGIA